MILTDEQFADCIIALRACAQRYVDMSMDIMRAVGPLPGNDVVADLKRIAHRYSLLAQAMVDRPEKPEAACPSCGGRLQYHDGAGDTDYWLCPDGLHKVAVHDCCDGFVVDGRHDEDCEFAERTCKCGEELKDDEVEECAACFNIRLTEEGER